MTSGTPRLSALDDPPCPWCETAVTTERAGNRLGGSWYCLDCERTFTPGPLDDDAVARLILEYDEAVACDDALVTYDVPADRLVVVRADGRYPLPVDAYLPDPEPGTRRLDLDAIAARANAVLAD